MFPVRMLFIRRYTSNGKYQNGTLTSSDPKKKADPKMIHFYCMKAYRDRPQIRDPQIRTVGNPIESKDV